MTPPIKKPCPFPHTMLCVAVFLFLAITSVPIAADGGAALNHLENSRSDSHTWEYPRNLRGLEDAGNYQEQDYDQEDGDDANYDDTFMAIEHEVETALTDMFYSAPSEWTPLHWAFFAGLVLIASVLLCWFCICCFIPCCCCSSRGSDAKPLVVRTEEEHNHYTNDLMVNDNHKDDKHDSDENDTDDDSAEDSSEHETDYTESNSNLDSSPSSFEESFEDEYQESDTDAYEFTNSHGDYYKYTGRSRRQLT